jgi:hypothetical protein
MIFCSRDYLDNRDDLDMFEAKLLVPELAALGSQLHLLPKLGIAATARWTELMHLHNGDVAGAIFELLVGFSCLRAGLEPEMLAPHRHEKTPDFRLHKWTVPTVAECKRRRGVTMVEESEGRWMTRLLQRLRVRMRAQARVELVLHRSVADLNMDQILEDLTRGQPGDEHTYAWGTARIEALAQRADFALTRLYSPNFLRVVFGWTDELGERYDGFVCQVDAPGRYALSASRNPLAICWTHAENSVPPAKTRGLTESIAAATSQIPVGEFGVLFVSYEEGTHAGIADRRTSDIQKRLQDWSMQWGKLVPVIRVNRTYAGLQADGRPDFIENTIRFTSDRFDRELAAEVPCDFFVPRVLGAVS